MPNYIWPLEETEIIKKIFNKKSDSKRPIRKTGTRWDNNIQR